MTIEIPRCDMDNVSGFLLDLLRLPSPSGYVELARERTIQELNHLGLESMTTPSGAVLGKLDGNGKAAPRALLAHLDVLGMMVKEVMDDGTLIPIPVGSFRAATVEGEYVTVHTIGGKKISGTMVPLMGSVHVHGTDGDEKRVFKDLRVRLDENIDDPDGVAELGIRVGDYVTIDPAPQLTASGYIKGRGLDDKSGVAATIGGLEALIRAGVKPQGDVWFCFTEQEEGGYAVPGGLPMELEELLAVDMGVVGLGQVGSERKCSICAKDTRGPYNRNLVERLVGLADKYEIAAVVDVYPRYGSELFTAALAGASTARAGLIGPGVSCSHAYERTHMEGLRATVELITAYLVDWC